MGHPLGDTVSRQSGLGANLRWGLLRGVLLSCLLSTVLVGLVLIRGSSQFERPSLSAWEIIGAYFVAGTVGGLVLGLLRPLTKNRVGAAVVGCVVGAFAYSAMLGAGYGSAEVDFFWSSVLGALGGGIIAYWLSGS